VLKVSGKMMWMSEVMNPLNKLNSVPAGHVAQSGWLKMAREMHAPTGRVWELAHEERKRNG